MERIYRCIAKDGRVVCMYHTPNYRLPYEVTVDGKTKIACDWIADAYRAYNAIIAGRSY